MSDLAPAATTEHRRGDGRVRLLFLALAALYLLPFWTVRYLPTVDGPSHAYNAWILRQQGNPEQYPLFQRHYQINVKPYPNWISQGTMALMMFVLPPLTSEKLLVSGYVLLFLGGMWYLTASVRAPPDRWVAFVAFPFAYQRLLQYGFYNFSISLALFPWILGLWWRNRDAPGRSLACKLNLLLWLCYFSHILSFALALAAIGVLWLATLRRSNWRRHLRHVLILLPQVALPLWFLANSPSGVGEARASLWQLMVAFGALRILSPFENTPRWVGVVPAALCLLLLVLTWWRRERRRPFLRPEDAFLLVAFLGFVLYLVSPEAASGGGLLKQRLGLYPYLLLIPWFAPRLPKWAVRAGTATLVLAAGLHLAGLTHWYRANSGRVTDYLRGLEMVPPNTRILALRFERGPGLDMLSHSASYVAIQKGLIDWENYEARHTFFPTRFRPGIVLPELPGGVTAPAAFPVRRNKDRVDAVYTWKMPADNDLRQRLQRHYRLVSARAGGELYVRKSRQER